MSIEKGFYYHYKHDDSKGINNYAYEIMGTAFNTESVVDPADELGSFLRDEVVIYRPLYDTSISYKNGKRFWVRPAKMFSETVAKDGKEFLRFQKITDPAILAELVKVRDQMYK
jgi:hypothetical protein